MFPRSLWARRQELQRNSLYQLGIGVHGIFCGSMTPEKAAVLGDSPGEPQLSETVSRSCNSSLHIWELCYGSAHRPLMNPYKSSKTFLSPVKESGVIVNTCSPSYSGNWSRRITWAHEFMTSLGNIVRMKPQLEKKKIHWRQKQWLGETKSK